MWKIEILTIFPGIFESFLKTSIISKAISRGLLSVTTTDIRAYSSPPHNKVDDSPYGGGAGMVMMVDPLVKAVEDARSRLPLGTKVILLSPAGARFNQAKAVELSKLDSVIFICGRYEGVDQRVIDLVVDEEISVGDFVVMGGEVPAMLLLEACVRLRPGVVHNQESIVHESFSAELGGGELVEGPQYTRPEEYRGIRVPEVLLSGDHRAIAKWRLERAKERSKR